MRKKEQARPQLDDVDRTLASYASLGLDSTVLKAAEMASSFHDGISESVRKAVADMSMYSKATELDFVRQAVARADALDSLADKASMRSDIADMMTTSFKNSAIMKAAEEAMQPMYDMQDLIKPQIESLSYVQDLAYDMSWAGSFVDETWLAHQEMVETMRVAAMDAFDHTLVSDVAKEAVRLSEMFKVHDWREEALATVRSMEINKQDATELEIDQASAHIAEQVGRAIKTSNEGQTVHQLTDIEQLSLMVSSLQQSLTDLKQSRFSKTVDQIIGAVIGAVVTILISAMLTGSFQSTRPSPTQDHRAKLKAVKANLREQNDNLRPIRVVKVNSCMRVRQTPNPSSRVIHRLPPLAVVVVKDTKGKMALVFYRNPITEEVIAGWVAKKYLAKIDR